MYLVRMDAMPLETEWRRWLVEPVVPPGEGPNLPLSMRVPEQIMKDVEKIAKETGNSRTDAILHLLRWAIAKYKAERVAEKKARGDAA